MKVGNFLDGVNVIDSTEIPGREKISSNLQTLIFETHDKKVQIIRTKSGVEAYIPSNRTMGATYPLFPANIQYPIKAVLMDLDGSTLNSEKFWISMIKKTIEKISQSEIEFSGTDLPFISGHSVSEHLQYCLDKFYLKFNLTESQEIYTEIVKENLENVKQILNEGGVQNYFNPLPGLKNLLYTLKKNNIKIGLVTSGLEEKVRPEIEMGLKAAGIGEDPLDFYDGIICAGSRNNYGTLGELCAKPHPWLYSEMMVDRLGISFEDRNSVVVIEDSNAGVIAGRLAGCPVIGVPGGNITADFLLEYKSGGLEDIGRYIGL
jgi:beta-phosphoglucomutase